MGSAAAAWPVDAQLGTLRASILKAAAPVSSPGAELLIDLAGGILIGLVLGLFVYLAENGFHMILRSLEKRSRIKRICPSDPAASHFFYPQSFTAVSCAFIPVGAIAMRYRLGFLERISLRFDPLEILLTQWTAMILHDLWFYTWHMLLHKYKWAFRQFHALHHKQGGSVSVFSTAMMEVSDLALTISAFHGLVLLWFYSRPNSWSVLALFWYFAVENAANMVGHCGYFLPMEVQAYASLGSLIIPWTQNSETHFVHHLDPRYNKALYFTWWDQIGGSYRQTHPVIEKGRAAAAEKHD